MKKITTTLFATAFLFSMTLVTKAAVTDVIFEDTMPIKILSWSGGGIRGLNSLYLAQEVDNRLGGGVNLVDQVDWHFGTSTGGITALAFANGYSIQKGIDLYEQNGKRIFPQDYWSWWRKIRSAWTETYTDVGLVEVLHDTLGEQTKFRDIGSHSARRGPDVVVTSYDVWNNNQGKTPYLFNSRNPNIQDLDLWKAGRATSAAPTYFPPYAGIDGHVFEDGGLYANDPSEAGLEDIRELYSANQTFNLLSFGTGVFNKSLTALQATKRGKLDWAVGISALLMDASTQSIERGLQKDLGERYLKLDVSLDHEIALDGISPAELAELRDLALAHAKENPEMIDRAAQLMQR